MTHIDHLTLHETGHFYLNLQFSVIPEFVTIINSGDRRTGLVYTRKHSNLEKNSKMGIFYTMAGGMIAETCMLGEFEKNRCEDDIQQIIATFGGFDMNEVFSISESIDKQDLMRAYNFIHQKLSDDSVVKGSDIVLKSGVESSAPMKVIALKRKAFGRGFSNYGEVSNILHRISGQNDFNVADFR